MKFGDILSLIIVLIVSALLIIVLIQESEKPVKPKQTGYTWIEIDGKPTRIDF